MIGSPFPPLTLSAEDLALNNWLQDMGLQEKLAHDKKNLREKTAKKVCHFAQKLLKKALKKATFTVQLSLPYRSVEEIDQTIHYLQHVLNPYLKLSKESATYRSIELESELESTNPFPHPFLPRSLSKGQATHVGFIQCFVFNTQTFKTKFSLAPLIDELPDISFPKSALPKITPLTQSDPAAARFIIQGKEYQLEASFEVLCQSEIGPLLLTLKKNQRQAIVIDRQYDLPCVKIFLRLLKREELQEQDLSDLRALFNVKRLAEDFTAKQTVERVDFYLAQQLQKLPLLSSLCRTLSYSLKHRWRRLAAFNEKLLLKRCQEKAVSPEEFAELMKMATQLSHQRLLTACCLLAAQQKSLRIPFSEQVTQQNFLPLKQIAQNYPLLTIKRLLKQIKEQKEMTLSSYEARDQLLKDPLFVKTIEDDFLQKNQRALYSQAKIEVLQESLPLIKKQLQAEILTNLADNLLMQKLCTLIQDKAWRQKMRQKIDLAEQKEKAQELEKEFLKLDIGK